MGAVVAKAKHSPGVYEALGVRPDQVIDEQRLRPPFVPAAGTLAAHQWVDV